MSLRRAAVAGAQSTAIAAFVVNALQLLQLVVLARILTPDDFGLIALVLVVLGFAQAFVDMGVSNALIHRQRIEPDHLSSLYWLTLLAGTGVFLLVLAATPLVVWFFNEPRLTRLLIYSSPVFLLIPIGQQFQALLQKELRFKELSLIEIVTACLGAVATIGLVLMGYGVFALVWGYLAQAAAKSLWLFVLGVREWPVKPRFERDDLKGYLSFGLYQMGERATTYFNTRVDQVLIGALAGVQPLGYYNLAFNLVIQPVGKINPILTRVAFPVFARVQDEREKLRKGYFTLVKILSFVNFPILLGIAAVAPIAVPAILGDEWTPAVELIQILALAGVLRAQANPVGALLLARGRADLGFHWNVALLCTQVLGAWLGASLGGVKGAALAMLILQVLYLVPSYIFLYRPLLGTCLVDWVRAVAGVLVPAFIMAGSVWAAIGWWSWRDLPGTAAAILLGLAIYTALSLLMHGKFIKDLWRDFRSQ